MEEPAVRLRHRISGVISLAALLAIALLICSFATAQSAPGINEAKKQLALITDSLANRAVSSIEILHMPDQVETRASVTPENLEKWFDFKIAVNKVNEWSGRDNLVKVLRTTALTKGSRMVGMHSAIIFNGSGGKRIGTLYVGRFFGRYLDQFDGADGAIANVPVSFKGDLSTWLKDMIPTSLR